MVSLDDAIRRINRNIEDLEAAKAILTADVANICAAASHQQIEPDYVIESALETVQIHHPDGIDLVPRIQDYWLQCSDLNGVFPYEIIVRAAEFLAASFTDHSLSDRKLQELATSSDWRDRLVAGWVVRDRKDAVAVDVAKALAADAFTDDNGFFLIREATGKYT